MADAKSTVTDVDKVSAEVQAMSESWPMIDALMGGTAAMRKGGSIYLPQWPKESNESYNVRLSQATLFPAFRRTVLMMGAKPFSKAIKINDDKIPEQIKPLLRDVDMFGTDIHPFLANVFSKDISHGLNGVLVDVPPAQGAVTRADEAQKGIRPYFTVYGPQTILGWKQQRDGSGSHLTQLRLMEMARVDDGDFGEKQVRQVRVLEPGTWRTYRKVENAEGNKNVWQLHDEGLTSIKKVPFVFFYGTRVDFGIGSPPLLDLAFMNVEHYQSSSDQQTILHTARVPILFAKAFGEADKLVIGASQAAMAASKDAELEFVEHSGQSIEAGRQSILDLEDRMRQTGAELLVKRNVQATARQIGSEDEGEKSLLQLIVENFEESAEQCIALMGEWLGITFEPEVTLFKDFSASLLGDTSADIILRAHDSDVISTETAFKSLQRIDIVSSDVVVKDEMEKVALQVQNKIKMAQSVPNLKTNLPIE